MVRLILTPFLNSINVEPFLNIEQRCSNKTIDIIEDNSFILLCIKLLTKFEPGVTIIHNLIVLDIQYYNIYYIQYVIQLFLKSRVLDNTKMQVNYQAKSGKK